VWALALQSSQIGGAGLDAFEDELLPEDSPLWDIRTFLENLRLMGAAAASRVSKQPETDARQ